MPKLTVRIAVAVDAGGKWTAAGGRDEVETEAIEFVSDGLVKPTVYIVTADLDIPEPRTVQASGVERQGEKT